MDQPVVALKETYWNLAEAVMLVRDERRMAIAAAEKAVQIGKENKDEPIEIENGKADRRVEKQNRLHQIAIQIICVK
jgi:hypothetical protein